MNHLKKPWSRRQKARRWTAAALLLLLAAVGLHLLHFTPSQAIRTAERQLGVGRTQVFLEKSIGDVDLYFSQNATALLVTPFRLSPRHDWRNDGTPLTWVDRTQGQPGIWAGGLRFVQRETGRELFQIFGLVELEGAASVVTYDSRTQWADYTPFQITAPIVTFPEGHKGFWAQYIPPEEGDFLNPEQIWVLDVEGQVIGTCDITGNWGGAYAGF